MKELWSDGRGWILIVVSAGWFLSMGVRLIYSALIPFFRAELQIDLTTSGLLLAVLWGAYAVGHVPGGVLGDRMGEGNILTFSTAISAVAILVVSASTTVWMLFVGTIAFGFATAFYGPTRVTIFSDLYADRAGSAIGFTMAAGSAGNAILPVAAAVIATSATWRVSFGAAFPLFVGIAGALWLVVPRRTSEVTSGANAGSGLTIQNIRAGLGRGSIPILLAIQICFTFVFQGFIGFYPTYLIDVKGLSPWIATSLFGLFFAMSIIVQPLSGASTDRFGTRWSLLGIVSLSVLGLWILPIVHGLGQLVMLTVVLSSLSGYAVVTQTYIANTLPDNMKGTGLGILKACWMVLGATSPVLVGVLGDYGYFNEAFVLLATIASFGLALIFLRL